MRRPALLVAAILLAACAKKDEPLMGAPTDGGAAPEAPAPLDLNRMAGTWTLVTKAASNDSILTTAILIATADTSGWTLTLPNRKPVPVTVTVAGDSVNIVTQPYESVLRKGVQVFNEGAYRLQGDSLIGNLRAHYSTKAADSVLAIRSAGVKAKP
jgi:hypothetical protein